MSNNVEDLASVVVELRELIGLTQDALARAAGVTKTTVYKIESGTSRRIWHATRDGLRQAFYDGLAPMVKRRELSEEGRGDYLRRFDDACVEARRSRAASATPLTESGPDRRLGEPGPGTLLQEVVALRGEVAFLRSELAIMRTEYDNLLNELRSSRSEFAALREALLGTGRARDAGG